MVNRNETGLDGDLTVSGTDIPFTESSYSIAPETSSSDFNDKMQKDTGYVSVHSTGTINIDGSNRNLMNKFLNGKGEPRDKSNIKLRFDLSEGGMRFRQVLLNDLGRDIPGGDKTSMEISWEADIARPI